jgi:hypothetical protein
LVEKSNLLEKKKTYSGFTHIALNADPLHIASAKLPLYFFSFFQMETVPCLSSSFLTGFYCSRKVNGSVITAAALYVGKNSVWCLTATTACAEVVLIPSFQLAR